MNLAFLIQTALFMQFLLNSLLFLWLVSVCWRLYAEKRRNPDLNGITASLLMVFGSWAALTAWWVWTIPLVSMRFNLATVDRLVNLGIYDLFLTLTLFAAVKLDYHLFNHNKDK